MVAQMGLGNLKMPVEIAGKEMDFKERLFARFKQFSTHLSNVSC